MVISLLQEVDINVFIIIKGYITLKIQINIFYLSTIDFKIPLAEKNQHRKGIR
jgi:hypothetical protein